MQGTRRMAWVAVVLCGAVGCGAGAGMTASSGCDSPRSTSACESRAQFITNGLELPPNASAARTAQYAVPLEGNPSHGYANALGGILGALASDGIDVQSAIDTKLHDGQLILLWQYYGSGRFDANESPDAMQFFLGQPAGSSRCSMGGPCNFFDGSAEFSLAQQSPPDAFFAGATTGGVFAGGPASVGIAFPVSVAAPPLPLNLVAARIVATPSASGVTGGVLGGAVKIQDVYGQVIPALADTMNQIVGSDPAAGSCSGASTGDPACQILFLVDGDCSGSSAGCAYSGSACDCSKDGTVSPQEVFSLVSPVLTPDLDLYDGCAGKNPASVAPTDPCVDAGSYHPLADGVLDSLSFGVAFTATTAKIDGAP